MARLGRLGPAAAGSVPRLTQLAEDPAQDEYVRDAARRALKAITGSNR